MTGLPGRHGALPDSHLVPDLLAPGLRLVFCGTALGRVSAERRAYYAHPGNFFWRTLHRTGLTPVQLRPEDYPRLLEHGIGLTDLGKAHFGNDAQLPPEAFDVAALEEKLRRFQPATLAFTSKTAAAAVLGRATGRIGLGLQEDRVEGARIWVLPSPSGQARRFWDAGAWEGLARHVGAARLRER